MKSGIAENCKVHNMSNAYYTLASFIVLELQ